MSARQTRIVWGLLLGFVGLACAGLSVSPAQIGGGGDVPPETLLPANALVYVGCDGAAKHKAAWEKTAAYEALYQSGLMDSLNKVFESLAAGMKSNDEQAQQSETVRKLIDVLSQKGCSFAISLPETDPPLPHVTLVIHEAGPLEPAVADVVTKLAGREGMTFESKQIEGRAVRVGVVPETPQIAIEVAWWVEGKHLVVTAGVNSAQAAVAVAAGKGDNITKNPNWARHRLAKRDFDVATLAWFDFGLLRRNYGERALPINPERIVKVNDILAALGVDTLGAVVCRRGYRGKSSWSETFVEAPGPRKGLLALADQKPIALKDLPPMPWGMNGFSAGSVSWSGVYDTLTMTAKEVAKLGPPQIAEQVEATIGSLPDAIGFDPKADLLDALGNVYCVYGDSRGPILGMDLGIVLQVKDAKTLRETIDSLLGMAAERANARDLQIRRTKKHGREIVTLELGGSGLGPSFAVDDKWLCIGPVPQTVEAFLLRLDGRLTPWAPSESYIEGFRELPKEFTSITASDPRKTYRGLAGLAPVVMPGIQQALKQSGIGGPEGAKLPVSLADFPPGELVARPLYPNISECTVDDAGIRWTSRSSLPTIPILGDAGGAATTGVLVALLLPAVQQAREAARHTQSVNNLKQLALAMHIYHGAHDEFPQGTRPVKDKDVKPDQRLSWMASILPYVEQAAVYNRMKVDDEFEAEANAEMAKATIPTFMNPNVAARPAVVDNKPRYGVTHYVGIAGLGKDGPTLGVKDKGAGIFAYTRTTRLQDITDGTSNTAMIAEASADYGAWARGGPSTIRAFTQKPYLNGPDGIGGPSRRGTAIALADGSVRTISPNTDPAVLEAFSTIAGGEINR